MVTTENLLNVIANIHGINIITRNKMKGSIQRNEMERFNELLNAENGHIQPEVKVVLTIMAGNLK